MENNIKVIYKTKDSEARPKTPLYDKIDVLIDDAFCDSSQDVDYIELPTDEFNQLKDEIASKYSYLDPYYLPEALKPSLREFQGTIESAFSNALADLTEIKLRGTLVKEIT